jgi:cell wall-associated NlpC family hydrolase
VETGRKGGGAIVQAARRYLGVPYRYGGTSRGGMDCSGLVQRVFAEALGIALPHSSRQVSQMGKRVPRQKLKPGDVVLFGSAFGINHSGIYTGQDKFIHASRKKGVVESSLNQAYWKKRWKAGRRLY